MIDITQIDFQKSNGLVPCIIQDAETKNVLMLGYMNEEALNKTIETNRVTFYSRSKERMWTKGETSGNVLELVSIQADCDHDTLLIRAIPAGPTCHTGTDTCFGESNQDWGLANLEAIIEDRKKNARSGSYTAELFSHGINKIAQKVGEEAVELVIEAKDQNHRLFLGEAADLLFHYLVLLHAKGHTLKDVIAELQKRHQTT